MAKMRPMTQERSVEEGIDGSSVFATAERTSGYGESSSSASALLSRFGSSNSGSGMMPRSWTAHSCQYPKHNAEWRGMSALCPFSTSFSSSDEAE